MILGQRIRLDPNNVQATFFERCAGAARFAYNYGLARWNELRAAGEKPNWRKLNAEVNASKASDLSWLKEIPWAVPNNALQDLGCAFSHFFRRVKARERKPGYPRFKKKGRCREGFAIEARALLFDSYRIKFPKLGVENLNVRGMTANQHLAKSVMDAALSDILRQLAYKAPLAGGNIVQANRWFPSSKTCHVCGIIRESLPLGIRQWTCECGAEHDRDENAAKNLEALAAAQAVTACCHGSADAGPKTSVNLPLGQESGSLTVN